VLAGPPRSGVHYVEIRHAAQFSKFGLLGVKHVEPRFMVGAAEFEDIAFCMTLAMMSAVLRVGVNVVPWL